MAERSPIEHINPPSLLSNPAFTQAVAVNGPARTIYIGMQNALDVAGATVGPGDLGRQTECVLERLQACLEAAGAGPEHVVQWTILVAEGQDIGPGLAAGLRWWGDRPNPPANT